MGVRQDFKVKKGLEVADAATIGGSLTAAGLSYPSSDGTNGQVLLTDGNGNLAFGSFSASGLADFNLAGSEDGDILVYNAVTEQWSPTDTIDISLDGGTF